LKNRIGSYCFWESIKARKISAAAMASSVYVPFVDELNLSSESFLKVMSGESYFAKGFTLSDGLREDGAFEQKFTLDSKLAYYGVKGNKNQSFLDERFNHTEQLDHHVLYKVSDHLEINNDLSVRQTDEPNVDPRSSMHLLQLSTSIDSDAFKIRMGDISPQFTSYTLTSSLEGFHLKQDAKELDWDLVLARSAAANGGANYQRNVIGARVYLEDEAPALDWMSKVWGSGQYVVSMDDKSTVENDATSSGTPLTDLHNQVMSALFGFSVGEAYTFEGEIAHTRHVADRAQDGDRDPDNLERFRPYVQEVIQAHCDDGRVLWWEIFNEPNSGILFTVPVSRCFGLSGEKD